MDQITQVITHKFEDGQLFYLIGFRKDSSNDILTDWVEASIVQEQSQLPVLYWSKQNSKVPFIDECENIDIESFAISHEPNQKENTVFAVHMEGNGLDEYHLLSKEQMINLPNGTEKIIDFYQKQIMENNEADF